VEAADIVDAIGGACLARHGTSRIPPSAATAIAGAAAVLNISRVQDALELTCARDLPAQQSLPIARALRGRRDVARAEILGEAQRGWNIGARIARRRRAPATGR
jgi:hypothetical protein